MTYQKCIHCGICCRLGICEYGKETENGSCLYLIIKGEKSSCRIMMEQNLTPEKMKMGGGCVLQSVPEVYEHYKHMYNIK